MGSVNWGDVAVRAGKTFLQAFLAVVIASEIATVGDLLNPELWNQAVVAGIAAFLSFAQNVLTALSGGSDE